MTFLEALLQVRELVDFSQLLRDLFFRSPSVLRLSASLSTSILQSSSSLASSHVSSNCYCCFFLPSLFSLLFSSRNSRNSASFAHWTFVRQQVIFSITRRRRSRARSSWTTLAHAFRATPSECQFCIFDTWLLSPRLLQYRSRSTTLSTINDDCLCHSSFRTSHRHASLTFLRLVTIGPRHRQGTCYERKDVGTPHTTGNQNRQGKQQTNTSQSAFG